MSSEYTIPPNSAQAANFNVPTSSNYSSIANYTPFFAITGFNNVSQGLVPVNVSATIDQNTSTFLFTFRNVVAISLTAKFTAHVFYRLK